MSEKRPSVPGESGRVQAARVSVYKPGVRGWWDYLRPALVSLHPRYETDWRSIRHRLRPSSRLVQADLERADWKRWCESAPASTPSPKGS